MKYLRLERPLAVLDIESTGTDPAVDKIIEISVLRIEPAGARETRTRRVNPGRPIPPQATAIHGIGDDDVRDQPTFRQLSKSLLEFLGGADLGGFNIRRFDLPLLEREFREVGLDLGTRDRRVIDVMTIFHRQEPRDLSAAVRFYLGREHEGAHGAAADVAACAAVLDAQLERYPELPRTAAELSAWCHPVPPEAVDPDGKFVWKDGQAVFSFGRHRERSLAEVAREDPDYLRWIAGSDFPSEARELVEAALRGEFPVQSM